MRATTGRLLAVRVFGACLAMTMLDACQRYQAVEDDPSAAMRDITLNRDADMASVVAAEKRCTALGGTLQQAGRLGRYACYAQFSDAGKSCVDSQDCKGECRAVGEADGQRANGQCTADNNPFGCYARVENGVVGPYICVD